MRFIDKPYNQLGLGLVVSGAIFSVVFYLLLHSTPLTALGISMVILGAVCLVLGRARPEISPEASAILLETGLENISALVEELGLRSKAIYLPSSLAGGQPQALIPLNANPTPPHITKAFPKRLIARYDRSPEDIGILVTTPGSATIAMLETKPGATSGELEAALSSVLVGMLDVADGVRVSMSDERITVELSHPRLEYRSTWFYQCLGSPLASIVASIASEGWDKSMMIEQERDEKGKRVIELGVLE